MVNHKYAKLLGCSLVLAAIVLIVYAVFYIATFIFFSGYETIKLEHNALDLGLATLCLLVGCALAITGWRKLTNH